MQKSLAPVLLLVSFALLAQVSCDDGDGPDMPRPQECTPSSESSPSNASGALIVTDISGSMRGFAQTGSARLFTLHDGLERAVRSALSNVEPGATIHRCSLGERLECNSAVELKAMDNPLTYSATESRLDLFLKLDDKEDRIDERRISVLISDGMQASGASDAGPCMGGADPGCVAHIIKQRVEKGYGVWIAMLMIPFNGTHFAERPLDDSHWQRIQQHTAQLAHDEYFQGVAFSVKRDSKATPFTSFTFQGVRPILVLALSKDKQLGRRFIEQFTVTIKRDNLATPAHAVHSMELAPIEVKPRAIAKVSLPPSDPGNGVRPVEGKRQGEYFDYLIECDSGGSAGLMLNWEEKDGINSAPEGVGVVYNLVASEKSNLPQGRLTVMSATETGYQARLSCQQIKAGKYQVWLRLEADLKIDPSKPSFWSRLSSDNTYEMPERLYGLSEVAQKVLEVTTAKPRVTDCIRFRVERQ